MTEAMLWFMVGAFALTSWRYVRLRIRYARMELEKDSIYDHVYSNGIKYRTMPKSINMPGSLFFTNFPDGNISIHYMQMAQSPTYRDMFAQDKLAQEMLKQREEDNRKERENANSTEMQ